jgi:hypothetical protein
MKSELVMVDFLPKRGNDDPVTQTIYRRTDPIIIQTL